MSTATLAAADDGALCMEPGLKEIAWLSPPAFCALPKGHAEKLHDDKLGATWSKGGSYAIHPSRYFSSMPTP